jgi:phosphoenolpyruvate synthase/pyruvate phosphate dikinase
MEKKNNKIDNDFIETFTQMDWNRYDPIKTTMSLIKSFDIGIALNVHDLEKTIASVYHQCEHLGMDKNSESMKLLKKLEKAVDDVGDMFRISDPIRVENHHNKVLKEYSRNIMKVLSDDNLMLLSTSTEILIKDEIGNKAYNIWQMHKHGLPVPEAFFLTFACCRVSYATRKVSIGSFLQKVLYYFNGEPITIRSSGLESMPGMLETIFIDDSYDWEKIEAAIMTVIDSWYSDKAKKYRKLCKIDDLMQIGVVIQRFVNPKTADGFSGIAFSRDTNTGEHILNGEVVLCQTGEKLASGEATPKNLRILPKEIITELEDFSNKLEAFYKNVQDMEFVKDKNRIWLIQNRNAKLSPIARIKSSIDFYHKGWLSSAALKDLFYDFKMQLATYVSTGKDVPIAKGVPSSNGFTTGKIVFGRIQKCESRSRYILIKEITTTDDLELLEWVDGVITTTGGYTSHPSVVCRQMEKTCIVSASPIKILKGNKVKIGEKIFNEYDEISIIGDTGEIFETQPEYETTFLFANDYFDIFNEKLEY